MGINWLLSPLALVLICTVLRSTYGSESEEQDAREGEDITLQCRFPPNKFLKYNKETLTYYWIRNTPFGQDNVAIGKLPLERNYQVSYAVNDGRYDLLVSNVTYEKDNGRFECRVKAGGSSETLHSQGHEVVVLSPPRAPTIKPGTHVHTQEDREMNFTCVTTGGSPEPDIKWYRQGSSHPLEAIVRHGRTRSEPSNATLRLIPNPEDDGATFRCVVWNRAMPTGEQLDATVDLEVDYFPRVDIGPINPLRVATGATATLNCQVKAKPNVNTVNWLRNGKFVSDWPTYTIQSVTVQDAGTYTCSADNGLGRTGDKDIFLDVLFPPTVTLDSTTYEAEEGGNVEVNCQVISNPEPSSIQWSKEGHPDFQTIGKTLLLTNINADMAGTYTCKAINVMSTSDGKHVERASTASVAVLVRHKPGRAYITPEQPKILEKSPATLTCSAKPPGWPAPQYRWYYSTDTINETDNDTFATGKTLTIPETLVSNEGVYGCQAFNELGNGQRSTVTLRVIQPPRFLLKLQNHVTKIAGEEDFSVSCGAQGKPRPIIKWYKDRVEIQPDNDLYEINSEITESSNSVYNAQTTLKFHGKGRPKTNDLIPEDRGLYMCLFQNEVTKVDSVMHLRIEHKPILINPERKVAYDTLETAKLSCRVVAYPKPELQWYFGVNSDPLQMSSDDRYEISTTDDVNDTYLTVLKIKGVKHRDYGDYYCKVANTLGVINPKIRLQPKGAPDTPQSLTSPKAGSNYVTLKWEAGFNGGLSSTKYFVRYHRVLFGRQAGSVGEQCANLGINSDWMEFDCGRMNPCNVTHLDQDNTYSFKVKAINTKGQSNYSNELTVTTKVDNITAPERVVYDPNAKTIMFSVAPTCLSLVAVAEGLSGAGGLAGWQVVDTITLHLSGSTATLQEAELDIPKKSGRMSGRHMNDPSIDDLNPRIRLKLCLKVNLDVCSDYTEAEIGQNTRDASALAPAVVIAIVVSCLVFFLFLTLLFIFCHCKLNDKSKNQKPNKDYEMDAMRSSMESTQNQPPPPYYQTAGMDNKALEHSMDLAMAIDDSKNTVYAGAGYGYHGMPHVQAHGGQNMSNTEWVNMAYMENSYTNSNNGGSVNSRDSLWQLKMANNGGTMPAHPIIDRQSNYAYDPMAPAGYDAIEDYAPYPHLAHAGPPPAADYNLRGSQNPSRQDYCSDPYASVHKPKKRMDQHIESPYHEVSGLPEAYGGVAAGGEDAGPEDKPHLSINYDDSLESGYSTPNSRARRVIREIIV